LEVAVRADVVLLSGVVYFVGASTLGYCLVVQHLGDIDGSGRVGDRARSGGVSYRGLMRGSSYKNRRGLGCARGEAIAAAVG
jgi:hypothetical protein